VSPKLQKREAFTDLKSVLEEAEKEVDAIIVEGARDVEALRRLGFHGRIETRSKVGVSEEDLIEQLSGNSDTVVVLTDFDGEGRRLNRHLSMLLERRGVRVEARIRRTVGRLMAALGVNTVEALDNAERQLRQFAP